MLPSSTSLSSSCAGVVGFVPGQTRRMAASRARVYADVNTHKSRDYWDYEAHQIDWGSVGGGGVEWVGRSELVGSGSKWEEPQKG